MLYQQAAPVEFNRYESHRKEKAMVREKLAEYAHEAWSGWMKYMFSKMTMNDDGTATMPKWAVERWTRQMDTKYAELSKIEKKSDRAEADRMLSIINGLTSRYKKWRN